MVLGVTRARMRVDVGAVGLLRRDDRLAAARQRGDLVHEEAVLGVDRLVARPDVGVRDQVHQLVGAAAAHDALRVEAVELGDRLAQRGRGPVRIAVQLVGLGLVGRDRLGARAQRRLVRRQLDRLHAAGDAAFAGNVGLIVEDAGLRRGASLCHGLVSSSREAPGPGANGRQNRRWRGPWPARSFAPHIRHAPAAGAIRWPLISLRRNAPATTA